MTDIDALIDRIVDGGLAPAELREALTRLDAAPDGWRRCTLAFLEARCLDEALRRPDEASAPMLAAASPVAPPPSRLRSLRPALAAAAILLAFGAGWLSAGRPGPGPVSEVDTPSPVAVAVAAPGPPSAPEAVAPAPGPRPEPGALALPSWVLNQPMPVSADARAAMEARGYRLDQRRRLVVDRLEDGRRVVVPVDRIGVGYAGGRTL